MKAFVIRGKHDCYFDERPEPQLTNPHSVKIKVKSCGICGTDLHIYEGEHAMCIGQLRVPGHEFSGQVVEVGEAVKNFKVGDRVVHEPIKYCGECYACRNHMGNVCSNLAVTGCNCNGGWQEYFVADEKQWHHIPDWITWEMAALVEPYTIAGQVTTRAELRAGDTVLIHGAGPIGLACADTAMHLGAEVFISEIADGRLELARQMGVQHVINSRDVNLNEEIFRLTDGEGVNIVLDCAGLPWSWTDAMVVLTPAGRFVPVAMPNNVEIKNAFPIMGKQLRISGSRLQMDQFEPVIARFALYKENIERMITDVFPFEESDKAFEYNAARDPKTGKVVVVFKD